MRFYFSSTFLKFWEKHPALLTGSALLLGTSLCINNTLSQWIVFLVLLLPFLHIDSWKKGGFFLVIAGLGFISAHYRAPNIYLPERKIEGTGCFSISSVKNSQSPFQRSILYQARLTSFTCPNYELNHPVPCQIYLPPSTQRPKANCDYEISGTLIQKGMRQFTFKPKKNEAWKPIKSSFSLAELRFGAKHAVFSFLKAKIPDSNVLSFLNALATGHVDERTLSMELNRLGLQHILAISGFHFALLALFLGSFLQIFLRPKGAAICLILLMSIYYLFLGDSPSVQRAWIATTAFFIGRIFNLRITALNALGVGLCCEIAIDPSVICNLGFILSFLCTLAILLLYPLMKPLTEKLLPGRTYEITAKMSAFDQWGYIMATFIRKSLAINLAVHLACLPVLLYQFHRFALLSILYNLFFPFWVSISLFLLCTATLFAFIFPPLGNLLFALNHHWTSFALKVSSHPPAALDFILRNNSLSYDHVVLILGSLFIAAILFKKEDETISKKYTPST